MTLHKSQKINPLLMEKWNEAHCYSLHQSYAEYLRDRNLTPRQAARHDFKLIWLLDYLPKHDRRWSQIKSKEMKTTPPRSLVNNMNVNLHRFRKEYLLVQKTIDELPKEEEEDNDEETGQLASDTESEKVDEEVQDKMSQISASSAVSRYVKQEEPSARPWEQELKNLADNVEAPVIPGEKEMLPKKSV